VFVVIVNSLLLQSKDVLFFIRFIFGSKNVLLSLKCAIEHDVTKNIQN